MRDRVVRRSESGWVALAGLAMSLAALPGPLRADQPAPIEVASPTGTGSVTRITREEIERRQWRTLADVLRAQPGIHLSQLGGRGQDALVLIRGNPSTNVAIRIDGIDMSDPGAQSVAAVNDADARSAGQIVPDLLTENIEQITILRGAQSARYGSDAIGGVIDIETRRGEGAASPWAALEVGGFGTTQQSVGIAGGDERVGYSVSYTNARTRGISSGARNLGLHERDADENDTVSGRLDLALGDAVSLRATGRWIDEDAQLDRLFDISSALGRELGSAAFEFADRRPFAGERKRLYLGTEARLALFDERWVQKLGMRFSDHDVQQDDAVRFDFSESFQTEELRFDSADSFSQSFDRQHDARRVTFDWSHDLRLTPEHTLVFGVETERESIQRSNLFGAQRSARQTTTPIDSDLPGSDFRFASMERQRIRQSERLHNHAAFIGDVFGYERVYGELTLRLDDHDQYGSGLTYRAALGYLDPSSKLRVFASVATGFRDTEPPQSADTFLVLDASQESILSDSFGTLVDHFMDTFSDTLPGDRTLERSVSRAFELGFELPLLDDQLLLGATAFASKIRGLPTTEFGFGFIDEEGVPRFSPPFFDSAGARTRGIELRTTWQANEWLRMSGDYTYAHSELTHVPVLPIPEDLRGLLPLVPPSGSDLPGVPRHRLNLAVEARPYEAVTVALAIRHVGKRKDNLFGRSETLGGYTVFDLATGYKLNERVDLFARVENLFDKDYGDLLAASQPGIAGYVGVRARY